MDIKIERIIMTVTGSTSQRTFLYPYLGFNICKKISPSGTEILLTQCKPQSTGKKQQLFVQSLMS